MPTRNATISAVSDQEQVEYYYKLFKCCLEVHCRQALSFDPILSEFASTTMSSLVFRCARFLYDQYQARNSSRVVERQQKSLFSSNWEFLSHFYDAVRETFRETHMYRTHNQIGYISTSAIHCEGSRSTRSTLFTSIDESDIESLTDSIIELADGSEGFMHTVTKNIQTVSAISESVRILSKSESANSEPESTNTEGGTHTCTLTVAEADRENSKNSVILTVDDVTSKPPNSISLAQNASTCTSATAIEFAKIPMTVDNIKPATKSCTCADGNNVCADCAKYSEAPISIKDVFKNFRSSDMLEYPEALEPVNFAPAIPVWRVFPF